VKLRPLVGVWKPSTLDVDIGELNHDSGVRFVVKVTTTRPQEQTEGHGYNLMPLIPSGEGISKIIIEFNMENSSIHHLCIY
jgi:hypothetical protein